LGDAIANEKHIYAVACAHSMLSIQDLVDWSGGIMVINPVFCSPGLASLDITMATLSTSIVGHQDMPKLYSIDGYSEEKC
jgi:uncharacterized phosphosugar-binding protein